MRIATAVLVLLLGICLPGSEARAAAPAFGSAESLLQWSFTYREHPEPGRLPEAVRAMQRLGLLQDQERAGYFVGFVAGVLASNPKGAARLIEAMLPLPPKDQGLVVRAVGYSRLPDWPALMVRFAPRMSERKILIDEFLSGAQPDLARAPLESGSAVFSLWGYYVATGEVWPVRRVIGALAWTDDGGPGALSWERLAASIGWTDEEARQSRMERAMIGSTAKWTLVSYAEHHRELVELYRTELAVQPETVATELRDVLNASERFEAARIRKEEGVRIEEMKRRIGRTGSSGSRAAYAGSVGLATACVVAGAVGRPELAIPCVVTGALFSGVSKLLEW